MLEAIDLREFSEPDRAQVQASVVDAVLKDPERFLSAYVRHPESCGGRYVCADLFKETFSEYASSREARGRYNGPVHNAAAVLSAEQFRRTLSQDRHPVRDTAVFLTGMPGAGKTSRVLSAGELPPDVQVVFEGQLNSPRASLEKVGGAIEAGLSPRIIAVLPRPETALENTFKRFSEVGRGAGIGVMASIQEGLPEALRRLDREYGDQIAIHVLDVRDQARPLVVEGKSGITLIEEELSHGSVAQRLRDALEKHRESGRITEDCYRQANGQAPLARYGGLDAPSSGGRGSDDEGRGVSKNHSGAAVLNISSAHGASTPSDRSGPPTPDGVARAELFLRLSRDEAMATGDPHLRDAWTSLDTIRAVADRTTGLDEPARDRQVQAAREQIANRFRSGQTIAPVASPLTERPAQPGRDKPGRDR